MTPIKSIFSGYVRYPLFPLDYMVAVRLCLHKYNHNYVGLSDEDPTLPSCLDLRGIIYLTMREEQYQFCYIGIIDRGYSTVGKSAAFILLTLKAGINYERGTLSGFLFRNRSRYNQIN